MTTRPEVLDRPPDSATNVQQDVRAPRISDRPKRLSDERGSIWLISPLWLCLLVAVIIRVWLIARTHGTLDGDEALLGIQAEHILRGERPIYFYGIPYFGSLEAYVAALLFALFGPSVAALRAETTGFALALVGVTWWLASLLAETAQLPRNARCWFTTIAALVAALPPLYDGIVELRTGGGWIESFIIMLLLLVSACRLTSRRRAGAFMHELVLRWAGIGFLVGFGMWIYPLVTVAIMAAALWIIFDRLVEISKRVRSSEALFVASVQALRDLPLALIALPTCVLGFTPGLIWGASNHWANLAYLFSLGGGWTVQRFHTVAHVATKYTACVAPRVIGGATPLEGKLLTVIHVPLLLIGVLCTLGIAALVVSSFRWRHPILQRARSLAALPTFFGACSALLFCTSSASASILISCNADFGGRYAAPLVLALPFFLATAFTIVYMVLEEKRASPQIEGGWDADGEHISSTKFVSQARGSASIKVGAAANRAQARRRSSYGRAFVIFQRLPRILHNRSATDVARTEQSLTSNHLPSIGGASPCARPGLGSGGRLTLHNCPALLLGAVCALLLAYLCGQATTYGLTNADLAFQSPYCTIAPANYTPLIAYMQKEGIRYAWATNLLGYQISFETDNAITLADPLPLIHPAIAINRIPAYTNAVAHADRPSLLVFVKYGDPHPYLLRVLDSEHIVYRAAFFSSQPGVDVLVVTPINRSISPFELPAFDIFYCATH